MTPWLIGIIVVGVAFGAVVRRDRRDRRDAARRAAGLCAYCQGDLGSNGGFWIEGRLICPRCAGRMRWRLALAFSGMGLMVILSLGLAVSAIIQELRSEGGLSAGTLLMPVAPALLAVLLTWGALRDMKSSNRAGQLHAVLRDAIDAPDSEVMLHADEKPSDREPLG